MSLWDTLKDWIDQDRNELLYARIDPVHADRYAKAASRAGEKPAIPRIESERNYFRLTLTQMYLQKKVKWLQEIYPAVHSLVECSFAGKDVAIPNVADASRLLAKQDEQGDVIARNFTLVPLMPFKGGTIRMVAGLFSVKGENYLNNFLGVMSDFAKLLTVPQLSTALTVAEPLSKGIQTLFGGKSGMHLGFHDTFVGNSPAGNVLEAGYFALIRAKVNSVDENSLYVVDDLLCQGTGLDKEKHEPFEKSDFMLLHVEILEERDDWNQLTSIAEPFSQAIEALGEMVPDEDKATASLRQALVAAFKAPELTKIDRRRVVDLLKQDFEEAKTDLGYNKLTGDGGFDLQRRMNTSAMDAKQAIARGDVGFAEIVDL